MIVSRTLFILNFAPLLMCQQPGCISLIPAIDDTILDQLSGRWYFAAFVFNFLPYKEVAQRIQSSFYDFIPNKRKDIILAKEYNTIDGRCVYQDFEVPFNRNTGTISKIVETTHTARIGLTQDQNIFYLLYLSNEKNLPGISFSVRTRKASEQQLKEFRRIAKCLGFQEEEILFTDWSKDKCEQLEKKHN